MKSSIELHNDIQDLRDSIERDSAAFNAAEGEEKSAIHDRIVSANARVDLLNDMLTDALKAEDDLRRGGGLPLAAVPEERPAAPASIADAFLGSEAEFDRRPMGLNDSVGKKFALTVSDMAAIRDAADATHQFALPTPTTKSYALPENIIELPQNFLSTLSKGTTKTNLEYMAQGAFTNNAGLWNPGEVKAESDESWTSDQANLFTVAHHIPISKQTASHYGQLQSIIANDLLTGLEVYKDRAALTLDEGAGKQGVLKKPGVQTYTPLKGEKFYDSLRRMINVSWMATGIRPNYVAVHPNVLVDLDLTKTSEGAYLALQVNGRLWGIPVVEDINLDIVTVSGSGDSQTETHTYGSLLYNNRAATWYTSQANALTLGYVNDQFIRNEYTLLAEGEFLLTVTRPKSFVLLPDAITPGK